MTAHLRVRDTSSSFVNTLCGGGRTAFRYQLTTRRGDVSCITCNSIINNTGQRPLVP
jgi:hypothetical protein